MSVDSPEPRQRTVAELLAENGGQQSGRRRRRRAEDDGGGADVGTADVGNGFPAPSAPPEYRSTPPMRPEPGGTPAGTGPPAFTDAPMADGRNGHRPGSNGYAPNGYDNSGYGRNDYGGNGYAAPDGYGPPSGGYTEQVPAGPPSSPPLGWAAPAPARGREPGYPPGAGYGHEPGYAPEPGPSARVGAMPPTAYADAEPESPTGAFGARPPASGYAAARDLDGGPPTQLGAPPLDDDIDDAHDIDERDWTGEHVEDPYPVTAAVPRRALAGGGPPTQAGFGPDELDEYDDDHTSAVRVADEDRPRGARRAAVAEPDEYDDDHPDDSDGKAAGTGQAWAMVIAQWIGGAIVGAGVWVGFRYLWTYLEVVALVLSVVVTVGLVLGVRALLRNDDLRTTMFAVLVGLLLTVSPALLVLLDR